MNKIIKITGLILLALAVQNLPAQTSYCQIKRTYEATRESTLQISNRYGNVYFSSARNDSMDICATVTIEQDDRELGQKSRNLVSININKLNDLVSVETIFDEKFFSPSFRQGRKSFSVDLLIKAPDFINLDITNEFGNITMDELSGKFNARLSYGLLTASKLTRGNDNPINSISVDYGKVDIDEMNWMSAIIHNCSSVQIGKVQALLIKSDFSKIRINTANSMVTDSRSDIYTINSLRNIISKSEYSTIYIGKFTGKLLSTAKLGSIGIDELEKNFINIDITSSNSPVTIRTKKGVSFRSDIEAINAPVEFSTIGQPGIVRKRENNSVTYTGIYGDDEKTESFIMIKSTSGKITVK